MKTKIFLLAIILFAGMSHSYSQTRTTNYEMVGSGSPNQILQVDKLSVSLPQQLIMKPSEIYEDNSFIGIGINTPSEKLHVAGNILAADDVIGTNVFGNIKTQSIQPSSYPNDININAATSNHRFLLHSNGEFTLGFANETYDNQYGLVEIVGLDEFKYAASIISKWGPGGGKGLLIKSEGTYPQLDTPLKILDSQNQTTFKILGNGDTYLYGNLYQNGTQIKPSKWLEQGSDLYYLDGAVGIGTDAPNATLDIIGTLRVAAPAIFDESINFWTNGGSIHNVNSIHGLDHLSLRGDGDATDIYIASDGNVGIGTDTPSSKLTIVDVPESEQWLLDLYNNNDETGEVVKGMRLNFKTSGSTPDDELFAIGGDLNKNKFSTTYFTVKRHFVGINKHNPSVALDINGDVSFTGDLKQGESSTALWRLNPYNDPYWLWNNIGIGEYEPEAKLHVSTTTNNDDKAAIIGNDDDRNMSFIPQLSINGYNGISEEGDFGIFWNDATGTEGKNGTAGFVLAPHASHDQGIRIDKDGEVEIAKLWSKEIIVDQTDPWYDFVFEDDYNLLSLSEVEKFIKENKHLPDIPSEKQVKENGINVAEMNGLLLKKVEELTLYIIELEKDINEIKTTRR